MCHVRAVQGPDDTQVIGMLGDVGKQIAYQGTTLAVVAELPGGSQQISSAIKLDAGLGKG